MLNLNPFLKYWHNDACFPRSGHNPDIMEMLNSFVSTNDKAHDDNLSILLEMLSSPVEEEDFSVLRALVRSATGTAVNEKGGK